MEYNALGMIHNAWANAENTIMNILIATCIYVYVYIYIL